MLVVYGSDLHAALAQQMQDRLKQQQQQHSLTDERPLVVCSKPDAATLIAAKRKQQAQYRWDAAATYQQLLAQQRVWQPALCVYQQHQSPDWHWQGMASKWYACA